VLGLLFARAEGRQFQLPGGDGLVVIVAGGWTALLIFYRLLDKPGLKGNDRITATVGVQWGIFIALLVAIGLVYAGTRMRLVERPEPPVRRSRAQRAGRRAEASVPREHTEPTVPGERPRATVPDDVATSPARPPRVAPVPARERSRYPPAPPEQLSFEDPPTRRE
jgi:hypothetical protein